MKRLLRFALGAGLVLSLTPPVAPQAPQSPQQTQTQHHPLAAPDDLQLPNGKSQQDEILKADHQRDLKDAAQLIDLAEQLKQELEKNDRHVLSISSVKKTEEIEKLAKRIHARLVR